MTTETINNTEISKTPLTLSSETESSLKSSAKWGFFLSIIGFVFVLFFLIVGVAMFFVSGVANEYSDFQHMPFPFPFPLVFIGILYLLMAVIYFVPSYNLLIFGQKILSGLSKRSQPDVEEGLKNLVITSYSIHYTKLYEYTDQTSSLTKSSSGGIMGFSDGTPNNCLGLNKSIISSSDSCYSKRIGYLDSNAIVNNNFASQSIIVKQNGNIKTNFTDIKSDGEDFNRNYTDFLNNYITTNSTFNEIPLKKWLIKSEVNNGFPFF